MATKTKKLRETSAQLTGLHSVKLWCMNAEHADDCNYWKRNEAAACTCGLNGVLEYLSDVKAPAVDAARMRDEVACLEENLRKTDRCDCESYKRETELMQTVARMRDALLVQRITAYLSDGGLWNPELALHGSVRDLLMDCRAALSAIESSAK